jgi:hypothetical protein
MRRFGKNLWSNQIGAVVRNRLCPPHNPPQKIDNNNIFTAAAWNFIEREIGGLIR